MEAKHTKAPWRVERWTSHALSTVLVDDPQALTGKRIVAECETEEDAAFVVSACNDHARLVQVEAAYNWLMDCARKTGVIVSFRGDTMCVIHGTTTDVYDDLLNACKAVDADIELTGKVSAASIDMVRTAIATAKGAA